MSKNFNDWVNQNNLRDCYQSVEERRRRAATPRNVLSRFHNVILFLKVSWSALRVQNFQMIAILDINYD